MQLSFTEAERIAMGSILNRPHHAHFVVLKTARHLASHTSSALWYVAKK